jgi:hypothetical protein
MMQVGLVSDFTKLTGESFSMSHPHADKVLQYLWGCTEENPDLYVYAILDAARNDQIYPALISSDVEYRCLYLGKIPSVLAEAAPYLVRFHKDSSFMSWLVEEGWADSWGIFFASPATFKELLPHFREFNMAMDEDGNTFYFRYYDPRVLRVYLPTCNASELETIFGPVKYFMVEYEAGEGVIEYSFDGIELGKREFGLEEISR